MNTLEKILSTAIVSAAAFFHAACEDPCKPVCDLDVSSNAVADSVTIDILAYDIGDHPGITWIRLYEDSILLEEKNCGNVNPGVLVRDVMHTTSGIFAYKAYCRDKDGNEVWSNEEIVSFSGLLLPPSQTPICTLSITETIPYNINVSAKGTDYGEGAGITTTKLFEGFEGPSGENPIYKNVGEVNEHGNPVSLTTYFSQIEDGYYRRIGRTYYRAECEDLDGNTSAAKDSYMFSPPEITNPIPDLEVKDFVVKVFGLDDDVYFSTLLRNNGDMAIRADITLDFGDGESLEETIDLSAGQTRAHNTIHPYISSGSYCATMFIDKYNLIKETDGNNNCLSSLVEVF